MSVFAAKILKAEVPEGTVISHGPPSRTRAPGTLIQSTLDVIFGTTQPRSGLGSASVETTYGKYQLLRDLSTNELAIEAISGRTPPDSSVISPGEWLMQRQRDPYSRPRPETTATAELSRRLLLRAKRLESTARRLAAMEGVSSTDTGSEVPSEIRSQLEAAVERVLSTEAKGIDQRLKQNAVITACLEDLAKGDSGNPNSEAAEKLRHIAKLMDEAPRQSKRAWAHFLQRLTPAWAAGVLAGGGVSLSGLTLDEPSWVPVGAALAGSGLAAMTAGRVLSKTGQSLRRRKAKEAALLEQATEALYQARVLLADEQVIDASFLRHKASVVARRDLVGSLAAKLEKVTLTSDEKERLQLRQEMVKRAIPKALRARLVEVQDREPMLAIPGLLDRLDEDYKRGLRRAERENRVLNVRIGAESALLAEAMRLRRRATALARQAKAETLWTGLIANEPEPSFESPAWESLFVGMGHCLSPLGRRSEGTVRKARPELLRARKTKGAPAKLAAAQAEEANPGLRESSAAPKHLRQRPAAARWRHQLKAPVQPKPQPMKTPAFIPPVRRANEAAASATASSQESAVGRGVSTGFANTPSPAGPRTQLKEHLQVLTPTALRAPVAHRPHSLEQSGTTHVNARVAAHATSSENGTATVAPDTVMHVVVNRRSRWARRSRSDRQSRPHRSRRSSARVTPSIRLPRVAPLRIQPLPKPSTPALLVGLKGIAISPLHAHALPESIERRVVDLVCDIYAAPTFALVSWQSHAVAILELSKQQGQLPAAWLALDYPKLPASFSLLPLPPAQTFRVETQGARSLPRALSLHPSQLIPESAHDSIPYAPVQTSLLSCPGRHVLDPQGLPRIHHAPSKIDLDYAVQISHRGLGLSSLVELALPYIAQRSVDLDLAASLWFQPTMQLLVETALPNTARWNRQLDNAAVGIQPRLAGTHLHPPLESRSLPPLRLRQSRGVNTLDAYTRLAEHHLRIHSLHEHALPTTPPILRMVKGVPFESSCQRLLQTSLPKMGRARRWQFERSLCARLSSHSLRHLPSCAVSQTPLAPRRAYRYEAQPFTAHTSVLNLETLPRFARIRILALPGPWMVENWIRRLLEEHLPSVPREKVLPAAIASDPTARQQGNSVNQRSQAPLKAPGIQLSTRKTLTQSQEPSWQTFGRKLSDPRSFDAFESFDQRTAVVPGLSVLENDHA